jgi:thioredoxin 1
MSLVVDVDDTTFEAEVTQAEMPVLADFTAAWCGPCKKLAPLVEEIAGEYSGRLKVVKVDVDKARTVAAKFAVMSVPTLILFDGGKVKDQVTGLVPKRAIVDRVEKVL